MKYLIGTYECKVDAKGRIMLPVAIKKQLSNFMASGFVLKRSVFNPCLELYPTKEWAFLMEKVNGLNRFNKKNNDFDETNQQNNIETTKHQRKLYPSSKQHTSIQNSGN